MASLGGSTSTQAPFHPTWVGSAGGQLDCSHGDGVCQGGWSVLCWMASCSGRRAPVVSDPRGRAGLQSGFGLPDQTHIRASLAATAPTFRLRRAGSRGRDPSSLRRLRPGHPSVRPPGSAAADRASTDGVRGAAAGRLRRRSSSILLANALIAPRRPAQRRPRSPMERPSGFSRPVCTVNNQATRNSPAVSSSPLPR